MDYQTKLFALAQDVEQLAGEIDLGSTGASIDAAACLRLLIKEAQEIEKALTKELTGDVELICGTGQGSSGIMSGFYFYATVVETIRWSIDSKAIKKEMGQAWFDQRCNQSTVRTVRYTAQE